MEFLKKLFGRASSHTPKDETSEAVFIYSQCQKCGETFRNRIDKRFDLMQSYTEDGPAYTVRKEIVGAYCRNILILHLEFDGQRRLTGKSLENGRLLSREEFEELRAAAEQDTATE